MRNFKKVLRYIVVPVIYAALAYAFIIFALSPVIKLTQSVAGMMVSDSAPNFNSNLSVIYDPEAHKSVASSTVPIEDVQLPSQGEQYANISCEEIGLDGPMYWGDTNTILNYGVGQYIGSFWPGYGRTILLCAHNTTYFNCLQYAQEGQVIKITTNYGVYEYEITKLEVILATKAENMVDGWLASDEEQLIMYTCYPFYDLYGTKTERLFVTAKKISGPDLV